MSEIICKSLLKMVTYITEFKLCNHRGENARKVTISHPFSRNSLGTGQHQ